jgi:hypothetical protein
MLQSAGNRKERERERERENVTGERVQYLENFTELSSFHTITYNTVWPR